MNVICVEISLGKKMEIVIRFPRLMCIDDSQNSSIH